MRTPRRSAQRARRDQVDAWLAVVRKAGSAPTIPPFPRPSPNEIAEATLYAQALQLGIGIREEQAPRLREIVEDVVVRQLLHREAAEAILERDELPSGATVGGEVEPCGG